MPPSTTQTAKPKHSSQHGLVIWHGMRLGELRELLAMRPEMHWTRALRIGLLPGMACYNSFMGALENLFYGRQLEQTELEGPPVFILGFWRSGTTLLHDLLTRDPQFSAMTMYRALFPWHFLLTERAMTRATGWLVPKSRPMDNVPMSWNAPQEDDVALCIMNLISPYTLMATPENYVQYWRSLDFTKLTPEEIARWKKDLMLLIKKVTLRDKARIVLKSPSHTFRIRTILEMFPDAKFVYIYRNPYNVFRSSVHLRHTVIQENGLGRPIFHNTEAEVIRSYQMGFDVYQRDKALIPAGNLHEVRFEDLEQDPLTEMQQVYDRLGLPGFETLSEALVPDLPRLKRYKKNSFKHDPQWMHVVYEELRGIFDHFGYPSPFEELEASAA